jgi:RNA polymerase sigma factor (sigma-70 family)
LKTTQALFFLHLPSMADTVKNSKNNHSLWQAFVKSDEVQGQVIFGQVIEQHYKPLLSYGTKLSKDTDFVKDCIHDLFINIWQKRQALTEVKSPRFYLLGALRNQILREIQKHKKLREASEVEDSYDVDVEFAIEQHIIMQEIEAENHLKIRELLTKITKRQREAIYLRFYQDLEYTEIAEIMGVATHSVVNLIYEAVKQLRQNWVFDLAILTLFY